jgi:hypothetical protein
VCACACLCIIKIHAGAEKDALAAECGVAVRSVEYWFWARNKRMRANGGTDPAAERFRNSLVRADGQSALCLSAVWTKGV